MSNYKHLLSLYCETAAFYTVNQRSHYTFRCGTALFTLLCLHVNSTVSHVGDVQDAGDKSIMLHQHLNTQIITIYIYICKGGNIQIVK